jgi:hypothetical protein
MFAFGIMGTLDPEVAMTSLFMVILFILFFEFMTGLLEYCIQDAPLYNKIVQHVYKELMQMGIVSFVVVLYESISLTADSNWIISIDFAHILLFFFCICFVIHAFFLMAISVYQSNAYLKMDRKSYFACLETMGTRSAWSYFLYYFPFLHLSSVRRCIEYKIINVVFQDTYCRIPSDFHFPLYLAKCFDRYSLRVIEVSPVSWIILIVLVGANFIRVKFNGPWSCISESQITHERRRFLLSNIIRDYFNGRQPEEDGMLHGEAIDFDDHDTEKHNMECYTQFLQLFFIAALILCAYLFALLVVARHYEQR